LTHLHWTIGISSPSGGGKTTIARSLNDRIKDSEPIFFDDYESLTTEPGSYEQWLPDGADFNAWQCEQLVSDLKALKHGRTIDHPVTGKSIGPANTIIFDAPLGYAHGDLGALIDFMIFVDTPLEIAMARRLLRASTENTSTDLATEMQNYLKFGRKCYLAMDRYVKPACDFIVDGSESIDTIVDEILSAIDLNTQGKSRA